MNLFHSQIIFAKYVGILIAYIYSCGYSCTLGEAFRTPLQASVYAKEGLGIKNSLHCKRLAIDINLISPEGTYLTDTTEYEKFGIYWESLDKFNRWGGRFHSRSDGNHFEYS